MDAPPTAPRRLALAIGIPEFSPGTDRPWPELTFATQLTTELCEELGSKLNGYVSLAEDTDPRLSGEALGTRVRSVLGADSYDVLIVHLLTHGDLLKGTKKLYAIGSDGKSSLETGVASWLDLVEDFGSGQVLFLLDLCYAGDAARQKYLLDKIDGRNRAWVIAAALPNQRAFNGYFTQATACVLDMIRRKVLQVHQSVPHVPFGTLVDWIRLAVYQFADDPRQNALPQTVSATPIDGMYPDLPFFPNPAYRPGSLAGARRWLDPLAEPFLDDLDEFDHFVERAAGYGPVSQDDDGDAVPMGIFTGRESVLTPLARWIEKPSPTNLRFVTGSPGAGKSAILGLLVCATHDRLKKDTVALWMNAVDPPIAREPRLVAIHARQRSLTTMLASIARQLGLDAPEGGWDAPGLIQAIGQLDRAPLLILDALDEATAPGEVVAGLLVPLAKAKRTDQSAACRILIGSRELAAAEPVRRVAGSAGLIDLDRIPEEELRKDLERYVEKLLGTRPPYDEMDYADARHAFAEALAARLARPRDHTDQMRWGEFLTACLCAYHFITAAEPVTDAEAARRTVAETHLDLPSVLEMDLEARKAARWLRPVLAALGYARGDGMPLQVIQRLAPVFAPGEAQCTAEEARDALDTARFYLRSAPDTDFSSLHRFFHAGLADYLKAHPVGQPTADARLAAKYGPALLARLRPADWQMTEPYVPRHAAEHAAAAGCLDTLLADPEFLVYADPAHLLPVLQEAISDDARVAAAVYRASAHRHRAEPPGVRRGILAVDAARHGALELARQLTSPPGRPAEGWYPEWATGGQTSPALLGSLSEMTGGAGAVTCLTVNSRPLLLAGGTDGRIRSWDQLTGLPNGDMISGPAGSVRALTHTTVNGLQILVGGDSRGTVTAWDAASGSELGSANYAHTSSVRSLVCTSLGQTVVAVSSGDDGLPRVWELPGCQGRPDLLSVVTGQVTDLDVAEIGGSPVVVTASRDGLLYVTELNTGTVRSLEHGHHGAVTAVACGLLAGEPVAVSVGEDRTIRVWNLTDGTETQRVAAGPGPHRAAWDSARSLAVVGGSDGSVQVIDLASDGPRVTRLPRHDAPVHAVACARPDQQTRPTAVTGDDSGTLRVWDLSALSQATDIQPGHAGWVTALAVTSAGGLPIAVSGSTDRTLRRWDLTTGRPHGDPLAGHDGAVNAIACATLNNTPIAVSGGTDRALRCWDLTTGRPHGNPLAGHDEAVNAIACATLNNTPIAVSGGTDRALRCWDLTTGRPHGNPLIGHNGAVNAVACLWLDGKLLAVSGGDDKAVLVWELSGDPEPRYKLAGHAGWVYAAACGLVGRRAIAATSDDDGTVILWNLRAGKRHGVIRQAHQGPAYALALGQLAGRPVLVSGGQDAAVRLWDIASLQPLRTIPVFGPVAAVALSRDAEMIIGVESEIVALSVDWNTEIGPHGHSPGGPVGDQHRHA